MCSCERVSDSPRCRPTRHEAPSCVLRTKGPLIKEGKGLSETKTLASALAAVLIGTAGARDDPAKRTALR